MKLVLGSLCIVFFLFVSGTVNAQFIDTSSQGGDISIVSDPKFPSPNEDTNITLESNSFPLGSLPISWFENGKPITNTKNKTKITIDSGNLGQNKVITAKIEINDTSINKEIAISPTSIDFIWEGRTVTPYWYMGRALFSRGSKLVVTAMPFIYRDNGNILDPSSLLYTWLVNDSLIGNSMTKGLQTIILPGSILGIDEVVEVKIYSTSGAQISSKKLFFKPKTPVTLWYIQNSLFGEGNLALPESVTVSSNEISLKPEPFFVSSGANYTWSIGGRTVDIGGKKFITLRSESPAKNTVNFEAVSNNGATDNASGEISVTLKP